MEILLKYIVKRKGVGTQWRIGSEQWNESFPTATVNLEFHEPTKCRERLKDQFFFFQE